MILETFTDTWNFTFLIAATIAIMIGTFLTLRKMKKEEFEKRREKRNNTENEETNKSLDKLMKKKKGNE